MTCAVTVLLPDPKRVMSRDRKKIFLQSKTGGCVTLLLHRYPLITKKGEVE